MHLAAKSAKVIFKYSCKAESLPKVMSSVEVSTHTRTHTHKGFAGRRQEQKQKIWMDYLGSKSVFSWRGFVLWKVDKK